MRLIRKHNKYMWFYKRLEDEQTEEGNIIAIYKSENKFIGNLHNVNINQVKELYGTDIFFDYKIYTKEKNISFKENDLIKINDNYYLIKSVYVYKEYLKLFIEKERVNKNERTRKII